MTTSAELQLQPAACGSCIYKGTFNGRIWPSEKHENGLT